jgi:ABC-type multidrug transport system fused ATPase/permease subunit
VSRRVSVRLVACLRPEWARLTAATALAVVSVLCFVAGPGLIGVATNIVFAGFVSKGLPAGASRAQAVADLRARGQGQFIGMLSGERLTPGAGVDFTQLSRVLGVAVVIFVLGAVAAWAQGFIMTGVAQRTVYRLRQGAEVKLARLPLRYFDSRPHGDILSRVTNDLDNLATTLQDGLSQLITPVLMLAAVISVMFFISPLLAGISRATIVAGIVLSVLIARRSKLQFVAQWTHTGRLSGLVEETHTGHALVLAFGQRQRVIDEFGRQNGQLRDASYRARFLTGVIEQFMPFIGTLNYVLIAVLGGYEMAAGAITLGAVVALVQYSRMSGDPVAQIVGQVKMLQSGFASAQRVFEFFDAPDEPVPSLPGGPGAAASSVAVGERSARASGRIQLQHVSFRYDPDRPLIEDFTLEVAPGQTVAIVGPSGAGKTTIVNLLMRFYEIQGGRILLDGTDYRDLSREQVRSNFGMVLQDTWLFAGTIRDNIAYGKQGATDEEIVAAARAAHVDQFVRTLPHGYQTVIDGDATSISFGQKQLLAIARAFLADPGILILDEATSNVDTRTEKLIRDAMARLRFRRTSFIIAHRQSTIRDVDTVVVMDGGRIIEQGSHEQLLSRPGHYRELTHDYS